jgi:hypothetical protein
MTCNEFQRVLPELEGAHNREQEEHLSTCSSCADLVADLNAILQEAHELATDEEPNQRVWNRIEIALRQEGLIREQMPALVPARSRGWSQRWLVPLTASFLLMFGLLIYERGGIGPRVSSPAPATTASLQTDVMPADQAALLKMVEARSPALRSDYESEFKEVNAYVHDAEQSVKSNPNDEIAQQYLTNAYEQRDMVYEMAMDRGQP